MPVMGGVLVVNDNGVIMDVIDPSIKQEDYRMAMQRTDLEKLEGVICPGFINAHCHLELSHLRGVIERGGGLPGFLQKVTQLRHSDPEVINEAMVEADREMERGGIIAVGDISNNDRSIDVKRGSKLRYHTFIEAFDLHPERADACFRQAEELRFKFDRKGLSASVVPHAPYTVSSALFKHINKLAYDSGAILTMHNQETSSEEQMFKSGEGALLDFLKSQTKGLYDAWNPSGYSSLATAVAQLPKCNKLLLVHNTFSTANDISWAQLYSLLIWWCLCPKANLYIEGRLPDVRLFSKSGLKMAIGTDSLSSNDRLSVLDELKILSAYHPEIKFSELLSWATLSPAEFFSWHREIGSLEPGKKPGVLHLTGIDFENDRLLPDSEVNRII